jgi:hypothetical protein
MNFQTILYWIIGTVVVVGLVLSAWIFLSRSSASPTIPTPQGAGFGEGDTRTVTVAPSGTPPSDNGAANLGKPQTGQKIFKVFDGPVTSATLVQTFHPTTTLARYVLQENGHALEMILENSGVVAHAVSNTTIPGSVVGRWGEDGKSIILQYFEDFTIKSVYLGFPASTTASSSKQQPTKVQFFPDNIADYGFSPDGKNVVYLLKTGGGIDGYTAKADGSSRKKLFSVPLSEVLVSWPSANVILLQTKSAAGVTGVVFAVNAQSGAISSLVYAPGLTAIADKIRARYQNRQR